MNLQLASTPEHLSIQLGACKAQLNWVEAAQLRESLARCLTGCLQSTQPKTANSLKQLIKLRPLAEALPSLEDTSLQAVLKDYPKDHLVNLVRYLRAEQSGTSEKIFAQLSRRAAEQLADDLAHKAPVPLHQVLPALAALEKPLAQQGVHVGINHKSRDYLQRLGQLPKSALAQLLVSLSPRSQTQLLILSEQLGITEIELRCRQIIQPDEKKVRSKADQNPLDEQEIRSLMALISKELKRLREDSNRAGRHA